MGKPISILFTAVLLTFSESRATEFDGAAYFEGIRDAFESGRYRFAMSMAVRARDRISGVDGVNAFLDSLAAEVVPIGKRKLTAKEAAFYAARTANLECRRAFGEGPYAWWQHEAKPVKDGWTWGKLDVAGLNGHSAVVRMRLDGTEARAKVYFSHDSSAQFFKRTMPLNPEKK